MINAIKTRIDVQTRTCSRAPKSRGRNYRAPRDRIGFHFGPVASYLDSGAPVTPRQIAVRRDKVPGNRLDRGRSAGALRILNGRTPGSGICRAAL